MLPPPDAVAQGAPFPFFGRLLRPSSSDAVTSLAGVAPPPPFLRAVQLTAVPEEVGCAHDVVVALQLALHECTLLAAQETLVSNSACLRVALLQHLITETVPAPLPINHPERLSRCFWAAQPMRYETQSQLLRLLALLAQHHAAASLCLELTRELDAARIVTTACIAAVADAAMRCRACDTPSPLSEHYGGRAGGPSRPFGVGHHPFAVESEALKFTEPSLVIARGMALDYFASLRSLPGAQLIFEWERPSQFGDAELTLVGQICSQMGFSTSDAVVSAGAAASAAEASTSSRRGSSTVPAAERALPSDLRAAYLTGELPELIELFPELGAFRDLMFLFRLFMCPEQAMLPARKRWRPTDAHLTWCHRADGPAKARGRPRHADTLVVLGFGLRVDTDSPLNLGLVRALHGDESAPSWADNLYRSLGWSPAAGTSTAAARARAVRE